VDSVGAARGRGWGGKEGAPPPAKRQRVADKEDDEVMGGDGDGDGGKNEEDAHGKDEVKGLDEDEDEDEDDEDEGEDSKEEKGEGATFPVWLNKCIVCPFSTVFAKMFKGEWKESRAMEVTVEVDTNEQRHLLWDVLRFMYGANDLNGTPMSELLGLLVVADRFGVEAVMRAVVAQIMDKKKLTASRADLVMHLPHSVLNSEIVSRLLDKVRQITIDSFDVLDEHVPSDRFAKLTYADATRVLLSKPGVRSENTVHAAITHWIHANEGSAGATDDEKKMLYRLVKYPLLSPAYLLQVARNSPYHYLEPAEHVKNAMEMAACGPRGVRRKHLDTVVPSYQINKRMCDFTEFPVPADTDIGPPELPVILPMPFAGKVNVDGPWGWYDGYRMRLCLQASHAEGVFVHVEVHPDTTCGTPMDLSLFLTGDVSVLRKDGDYESGSAWVILPKLDAAILEVHHRAVLKSETTHVYILSGKLLDDKTKLLDTLPDENRLEILFTIDKMQ
jgi:hypothetical protein